MGSEPVEELPDDLEAWVAERAAGDDSSRAAVLRRLVAAHRLLDEHPDQFTGADVLDLGDAATRQADAADIGIDDLDARVAELSGRVEELEGDLDQKITDVRQRVIQVKREADAKAPADHDHPGIEHRIDEGFGNYEEVLEYLTEQTEALEDEADDRSAKLSTVANAVVDLRRRVAALEGSMEEHAAVAELREAANRRGISEAACGSCGGSVRIGLLDRPACPHCESPFDGIESRGWFRSNQLTVGDRPALESGPTQSGSESLSGTTPGQSGGVGHPESEASVGDSGGRDAGDRDATLRTSDPDGAHAESAFDPDGFAGEPVDGPDDGDADDDGAERPADGDGGGGADAGGGEVSDR